MAAAPGDDKARRAYSTLRHRDFRLLWGAELASTTGAQMQRVAIAWQVYDLTGDALKLGLLGLARFLPIVEKATAKVDLARTYEQYAGKAAGLGLLNRDDADLDGYVTAKALDGLYFMIGEQEKKIRKDPVSAGSAIESASGPGVMSCHNVTAP